MSNTILAFTAAWCGPCKAMKPMLQKLQETTGGIIFYDVDEHRELTNEYKVGAVPTFVVLDAEGQEIDRFVGQQPQSKFVTYLSE